MSSVRSISQAPSRRGNAHRRGLTLIELIVVLVILTALGAILVPIIGNAITRSHLATCLTNFPEVTKMLNQASNLQGGYGNNWTNPVDVMEADSSAFAAASLSADEVAALAAIGLEEFTAPDPSIADYNVTFNNGVESDTPTALGATDNVAVLTDTMASDLFLPTDNGEKYVFFAIDKSWSLLGTVTPEPPVHFSDSPGSLPDEVYSRFGAIFQVAENNDATPAVQVALPVAQFKRVTVYIGAAGTGGSFETADAHSGVYWQEVDTQN